MYTLIIGRSYPENSTGMTGTFEYEHAVTMQQYEKKAIYAFCDMRSIKVLRKIQFRYFNENNIKIYGCYFPIGGIPKKIFDWIKTICYKKIIKKLVKENGMPSRIHIHFPLITINSKTLDYFKSLKVPIIITEHWSRVQNKKLNKYYLELLQNTVNNADEVICVSNPLRKSMIELTGTPKNIHVVPNMVSSNFKINSNNKFEPKKFRFIFVGRLIETKKVSLLVEAFHKAFSQNKNVQLVIIGNGPEYTKIEVLINKLLLSEQVILEGMKSRNETAKIMNSCHVLVSASEVETFGVPFIEAMYLGLPVIGIVGSPLEEHIKQGNGILFSKNNIEELAFVLGKIKDEYQKYNPESIKKYAYDHFSDRAVIGQLNSIYENN